MDSESIIVFLTAAGIIVSAVLSILDGRRQTKLANAASLRSEAAARISDQNAERVITALEKLAKNSEGVSAATQSRHVRWSLAHDLGDTYRLTNEGNLGVEVTELSGHQSLIGPDRIQGGPKLQPGEAMTFIAARSLATSDSTILVCWTDDAGEEGEWRYPLPVKPSSR